MELHDISVRCYPAFFYHRNAFWKQETGFNFSFQDIENISSTEVVLSSPGTIKVEFAASWGLKVSTKSSSLSLIYWNCIFLANCLHFNIMLFFFTSIFSLLQLVEPLNIHHTNKCKQKARQGAGNAGVDTQMCIFLHRTHTHTYKTHTHTRCKQTPRYLNHAFVKHKEANC